MISTLLSDASSFNCRDEFCSSNDSGDAGIMGNAYHSHNYTSLVLAIALTVIWLLTHTTPLALQEA